MGSRFHIGANLGDLANCPMVQDRQEGSRTRAPSQDPLASPRGSTPAPGRTYNLRSRVRIQEHRGIAGTRAQRSRHHTSQSH
eukprot:8748871-Pyramimonas_sp.AAC.1